MVAAEAYHRAGGLAPVDVIHDKSFGRAERCEGYAKQLLDWYDPPSGSVVIIISNSVGTLWELKWRSNVRLEASRQLLLLR